MRPALILTLALSCTSPCWAQSAAPVLPATDSQKASSTTVPGVVEKRTERIHIEDAGSRIDELRVGGETLSITVQPKGRMPAYQIQPASGERSWKIFGF